MSDEKKLPQEQPVDKEPADEISSSAEPVSEVDQLITQNPKLITEQMETHAHHIHKAPGHGWKHYFFEFLMLFLAVFCGFLAENFRENKVEHQREKQFVRHLLADLRADSAFFAKTVGEMDNRFKKHQEFYKLMTSPVKPSDKDIISGSLSLLYMFDVQITTATYNQMKASGSLRYIQNDELTNVLQQYYEVLLPRIAKLTDIIFQYFSNNIEPFRLKHFRVQDYDPFSDTIITTKQIILDHTAQTDQELLNIIETYGRIHKVLLISCYKPAAQKLDELISLLKKEYHLD